jgi:FkbM family methyltransferase
MFARIEGEFQLSARWRRYRALASVVGAPAAMGYFIYRLRGGARRGSVRRVKMPGLAHPLHVRLGSSDVDAFHQIFIRREYAPLEPMTDVGLILDCGANVGYASAWFLARFPGCHVVAVEPDADNFAALRQNLAPFGQRVIMLRAGIWSHPTKLAMSHEPFRGGGEWTKQVRECDPDQEAEFDGVTVGSLLESTSYDRISLLKMDVEGAEAEIFRGDVGWLDKVDAIAIELHDDSTFGKASEIFSAAIREREFDVTRHGELTICRRPTGVERRRYDAPQGRVSPAPRRLADSVVAGQPRQGAASGGVLTRQLFIEPRHGFAADAGELFE